MREFLQTLNENAGALNVVFGFVVMTATVVYALLTAALVAETKRMRRAQTEPEVVIRLQPSETWLMLIELVVENNGMGTAYDLELEATPDFEYKPGSRLSDLGLFKHGLRVLGPRQSMKTFLMSVAGKVDKIQDPVGPLQFAVTARYRTAINTAVERRFDLDLRFLLGLAQVGSPPLRKIARSLEELQKEVKHLASGFHRLHVIAYSKADAEEENARLEAHFREERKERGVGGAIEEKDEADGD